MNQNSFTLVKRLFLNLFLVICLVMVPSQIGVKAAPQQSITIELTVDTLLDSNDPGYQTCDPIKPNDCSLRGAISKANAYLGQRYTISLPTGTYALSIWGDDENLNVAGDLDIRGNILLLGNHSTIDAQRLNRVLQVLSGATLTLQDLTITGGMTLYDNSNNTRNGGGIFNDGSIFLVNTSVTDNQTGGGGGTIGNGGGIYNTGWLRLFESSVSLNSAGSGGGGSCEDFAYYYFCYTEGGQGGSGGGIYNTGHTVIQRGSIIGNVAGHGGWPGANGGLAGGIYNSGSLEIYASQIQSNIAGVGAGGNGDCCVDPSGGLGGSGGGIFNTGLGSLKITNSWITSNHSGSGGAGGSGKQSQGAGGDGGKGGGIYNASNFTIENTPIEDNYTGNGGNSNGSGGSGGGVWNEGNATILNSPVTGNNTGSGGSGGIYLYGYPRAGGNGGTGGGIYNTGNFTLTYSPILSNTTGMGGSGYPAGDGGHGGAIFNSDSLSYLVGTVAYNSTGTGGEAGVYPYYSPRPGNGGSGGGIYNTGQLILSEASIQQNHTGVGGYPNGHGGNGGGLLVLTGSLIQHNVLLAENQIETDGRGSGAYLAVSAELSHTTITRNTGGDGSGIYFIGQSLTLTNTIVVSQTVGITTTGTVNMDGTLWCSGAWANLSDWGGTGSHTQTHDVVGDPGFVNPTQGDYHLVADSPAIDQGIPTSVTLDIDNQPRPNPSNGIPDLGADEYWELIPIQNVSIQGSSTITASVDLPLNAIITPIDATPNILYIWTPSPNSGQGSSSVVYGWEETGTYTVTVTASNAGSLTTGSLSISVVPGPPRKLYLPLLFIK